MPTDGQRTREIIDNLDKEVSISKASQQLKPVLPSEKKLLPSLPRLATNSDFDQQRRLDVLSAQGIELPFLSGKTPMPKSEVFTGNIENFIGTTQIPVGVVGPLRINGAYAKGDFYVPLATTEGVLVASYNRGAMALNLAGGASVLCLTERVARVPGFKFHDLVEAGQFVIWVSQVELELKQAAATKTRYGELKDIRVTLQGNYVFVHFEYTTGDASGQNMVTVCTEAAFQYILSHSPITPQEAFLESNLSGDKKATSISFQTARGKKVSAEAWIPAKVCTRLLHAQPEKIIEYTKLSTFGATQSGTLGIQGHFANALAGLYIACGQDAACVSESHVGITRVDMDKDRNVYFSVTLPNLIVGTVGGGTGLPTQKEALEMIGCYGTGKSRKFAEICAATVLAGEISIIGAMASGEFSKAHEFYARDIKAHQG